MHMADDSPQEKGPREGGIVEFRHVRKDPDGTWRAEHVASGEEIQADTRERLELRAVAKRVTWSLRGGVPRQRDGDR